jgi:amino acid permease
MRFQILAIMCITWIAMSYGLICLAEVGEKTDNGTHNFIDVPQEFVVCTG